MQQVCDRVGIFVNGKLIAEGDIPTLSKKLLDEAPYTVEIKLQENHQENLLAIQNLLKQTQDIKRVTIEQDYLSITCTKDITSYIAKTLINADFNVVHLHKKEFGLDDIYQRYFENTDENHRQTA